MMATKDNAQRTLVFIAPSEADSNLFYATRFLAGDAFIYLEINGKKTILVSEMELGRASKEARVDQVLSTAPYENRIREGGGIPRLTEILDLHLQQEGVKEIEVPASFSLGNGERLRSKGYQVSPKDEPIFPARLEKTPEEMEWIAEAQGATEEAMEMAIGRISESRIDGDQLRLNGEVLTAERLREEIRLTLLRRGYFASEVIVSGGDQGCDPHVRGSGPLPANATIILDIFPRSLETRYWGDMTRTVVRGAAPDAVKKLYRDVLDAQELVFSLLRPGAEGMEIHTAVVDHFKARGNETGRRDGKAYGFMHGTGHGVGIDIHELPQISKAESTMKAGNVVTVEPGLYYPGLGAVRLEDMVVIEDNGIRNLNKFPKVLEV